MPEKALLIDECWLEKKWDAKDRWSRYRSDRGISAQRWLSVARCLLMKLARDTHRLGSALPTPSLTCE